jgi:hypothetical protein
VINHLEQLVVAVPPPPQVDVKETPTMPKMMKTSLEEVSCCCAMSVMELFITTASFTSSTVSPQCLSWWHSPLGSSNFQFISIYYEWQFVNLSFCFCYPRPQGSNLGTFNQSWATVWIKMGTSWACIVLYIIALPMRRFGQSAVADSAAGGSNNARTRITREIYERETVT